MASDLARESRERNGEVVLLEAVLQPQRSLGPRGFLILMALVAVVSFAAGVFFLSLGAWPITGFFGLDGLLIYLAFRSSYRAARAHETVRVTMHEILIRRMSARGAVTEVRLNPYWVRLHVARDDEGAAERLSLTSHGRRHDIAAGLDPGERERFARALAAALAGARGAAP